MTAHESEQFLRVLISAWFSPRPVIVVTQSLTILQVLYIGNATYPLSSTLIKLALLFQYLRVFETGSYRFFCKCMIAISIAWGAAFMILRWFPCYPVAAYWDSSIKDARCWGFGSRDPLAFMHVYIGQATSTAILDFIVFAIPIRLCFKPETPRITRVCLLGLFAVGVLYVAFGTSSSRRVGLNGTQY